MADGNVVDAASVKVSPDTSSFRRELRAELAKIDDDFVVNVTADIDTAKARAQLEEWKRKESGETIKKKVEIDTKNLDKAFSVVGAATRSLASLSLATGAAYSLANAVATVGPVLVTAAGAAAVLPGVLASAGVAAGAVALGADGIKKAFEGAKPAADALKTAVSDTFQSGLAPAVESVNSLLPKLTGGFQNVAQSLSGVANDFMAMAASSTTVGKLDAILSSTSTTVKNLGAALTPISEGLIGMASIGASLFADMTAGAGAAAVKFREWVASAEGTQQVREWITGGVDALKQIGAVAGDVIGSVRAIGAAFSDAGVSLGSTFGAATQAIRTFLESAQGQEVLRTLATTLQTIGTVVRDVLSTAFQTLGPAIQAALPGIAQLVQQIGGMLVPALQVAGPILTGLFSFLSANMGWIGPLATSIGLVVAGFKAWAIATNLATVATKALQLGLQAIGKATWIGLIITAVIFLVTVIVQNWDTIKAYLAAAWQWISDTAVSVWNGIVSFFTGLWNGVSSFFSSVWSGISSFLSSTWSGIVSTAVGIWNGLVSFLTGIVNGIGNFFRSAWNGFVQIHVAAFNNVRNAVSSGIDAVVGFVRSIPGRIVSALGNLGRLLWNAGKSIIDGLLNGLKSAIGGVYNFVSGIAGRIAALKGPLPYDRRLLIPAGNAIIAGLHEGLAKTLPSVLSLASSIAPQISREFSRADLAGVQWGGLETGLSATLRSMTDQVRDAATAMGREISAMTFTPSVEVAGSTPTSTPQASFSQSPFVSSLSSPSPMKAPAASPTTNTGTASPDYGVLLAAVADGVLQGFNGARLRVDRNQLAQIVNDSNNRNIRR